MATTAVTVMLVTAFFRRHETTAALSFAGYGFAFASLSMAGGVAPRSVTALLIVDRYGLFYTGLILLATLFIASLSYSYFEQQSDHGQEVEEFYVLLALASLGASVLVVAAHFVSLFLGLELMGVSLYGLIGYMRDRARPIEAAIKYLVLSAAASAFLLFGMALIYFDTGTMEFARIAEALRRTDGDVSLFVIGTVLLLTAMGFKLAVVPFHMWTPDVYEEAPAPVSAFVATVSKGAVFAVLLRYFMQTDGLHYPALWLVLSLMAALSMLVGNLLALFQQNIKRLLAYSSIAQLGYLLVAFLATGPIAVEAVSFYLVAYFITTLGAFGVVSVLTTEPVHKGESRDADRIEDYQGLFWRRPWLSSSFTLTLLSLAGIPLTVGFLGKFYAIAAGVQSSLWFLIILLVANSVVGLFYYLRIVVAMTMRTARLSFSQSSTGLPAGGWPAVFSVTVLTLLVIGLGLFPDTLIRLIQAMPLS